MNKKEILIICLIMCFILSLQAVAAADVEVDNNSTVLLKINNVNDVSVYALPDSQDTLLSGSGNAGTFSDLQGNITGDEVTLVSNYTWNSGTDSGITEGIAIDHDMKIKGYGVIIDAQQNTRVFEITNGAHVTLEGITFINGKASGNGGSILSDGVLSIYNCTFIDNTAGTTRVAGDGGAIYTTASGNTIYNSNFTGNIAYGDGGAVKAGTTDITKSTFKLNEIKLNGKNGGAVNIGDTSVVSNSTFIKNTATGAADNGGGAIYAGNGVTIKDHSNFINNTCTKSDGGAVYVGDLAKISNTTFINNTAGKRAGALRVGTYAVISDCNFTNSRITGTSLNYGGAVSAGVDCEFYNSIFINNRITTATTASGGAINTRSDVSIKIISGCTFINNAAKEGGAVKAGTIYVVDSVFINNTASTGTGGAILGSTASNSYSITLVNCNFTGNNATSSSGGAVYASNIYIYDCNFNSSYAKNVGGAIYTTTMVMNNTNFTSNYAVNDGGAIRTNTATITHSNFNDNKATNTGGAIKSEGTITISNSTFTNNRITGNSNNYGGGAIATGASGTTTTYIYDSNFTNNTATSYGGAVRTTSANAIIIINNTTFTANHVYGNNRDGGAVYITSTNAVIANSTFTNNTAVRYGGDIYLNGLSGRVEYSNFTGSSAGSGGSIYWNDEKGNIIYSNFTDTKATNGGAIYITSPDVSISNSIFNNNNATVGGAIYTSGPGTKVSYSNFTGNNATVGGAIYTIGTSTYAQGTRMIIEYSNFTNNHAINDAGAIYMGYNGEINDCNFTSNTAINGGAVVIAVSDATIERSIFENNNATLYGGSIYVRTVDRAYIYDSTFRTSFAYNGGAIYNEGNSGAGLTINNDTFIKNIASHNGGAIYYVVDKGNGDKTKIYHDREGHFEDEISVGGNRISVTIKNNASAIYGQLIANCLFVDNDDYLFNVSGKSMNVVSGGVISIYNPKDIDFTNFKIVINLTHGDTLIQNLVINPSNWDENWYNPSERSVNINIRNLIFDEVYNVTVGFEDTNYLYKEGNSSFRVTGNSNLGDFQVIKKLIQDALDRNENEITLPRSYEYNEIDISEQTGCINITTPTSFTINGNGNSIDANGYCRIFYITSANVTFNNVILRGGNASGLHGDNKEYGGAVYWSGVNGTLNNVNITSCYAGANGGGIYFNVTAANATVHECTFTNNVAVGNGGAIDCNATRMYLTETTFISNRGVYGASLCREENATAGYGIYNTFIGNNATEGGAALGWIKAKQITITNYTFINNTAGKSGGAIFVDEYSASCTVINCTFEGNYIYNETSGHGGAIEWYADKGVVINSTFTRNHAYDGGAIFANDQSEEIIINNSHFNYNYAYSSGGAISLEASKVTINQSTFRNNNATKSGGAVYVSGAATSNDVAYSVFENNHVSDGNGGAIDWLASAGLLEYSNFTNNSAVYGGAVYLNGISDNSNISNCIFTANNASKNGGAIDWNATNGGLFNNQFISNEADYGAALCRETGARGGNGTSNIFISNHARISGAALGWLGSDNIKIVNYNFTNNTAVVSGGAIFVNFTSNNCSVIDCNFIGNRIYEYNEESLGGAIDWRGANGTVINSNFTGNHAFKGGAIFVGTEQGITNITNSTFIENSAHDNGGAIDMNASSVHLNKTIFKDNTALRGGAVFVGEKGSDNYIYNSTFENNKAISEHENEEAYGGAINWLSAAGNILYSNFTNNYADYGGAIYLNGKSNNTLMDHIIFKGNNATKNGGALDWNSQNGQLFNCSFISNYAGEYGAALCREVEATGGNGRDNVFEYNHAGKSGAALAWMGSVGIKIVNYTFNYNTANVAGAAIYIASESHNCSIINSTFTGNEILNETGGHGGAIYAIAQNTSVENTNFTENKAYYGGAIFVGSAGGSTNITDSQFIRNSAVNDGGAVYLTSSYTVLNRTTFINNTAINGGAINAAGTGEVNQVYNSSFDGNRANGGYGGAINWVASAGYINYTNFTNNYAKYGGALHFNGRSDNSKVSHVRFESNTATENGGAIECNSSEMELTYADFISNYAKYGAALCRESGATRGYGHNNTFDKNHAYISGAALAWMNVSNIKINNYTFTNNTAEVSGAAIYVSDDSDNCKVHNCRFEDNFITSAISGRGGAIDWIGDNGEVINTTFDTCVAIEGGAIYVAETSNNMTIINSSFTSCQSNGGNGGALQLRGSNVTITLSNFTSCNSIKSGGAIAPIGSDNLTITSSRFISCLSLDFGGAIAGLDSDNANITDCYFKYNHAAGHTNPDGTIYGEGGAIYWGNSTNLNVSDSIFFANNAFLSGGSISANNCNDSVVYNIKTYNETAQFNGGSISWINSRNVTIEQALFNDSGSSYNGGSIYLNNIYNTTVKDAILNSTWASWGYGGGIYAGGNVTINNITLRDGHDYHGDSNGIYFAAGNFTVVNSTFKETTNTIFVTKDAAVNLTNNNITGDYPTKNVTYVLKNNVTDSYDVAYSVWNDGNLSLYNDYNDTFDYVIINNGTIKTHVTINVLGNETVNATWNTTDYLFTLHTTDDNNNTIISVKSTSWNNVTGEEGPHYPLDYNAAKLSTIYQGSYTIYAKDLGFEDYTMKTGAINVKMPTQLTVSYDDITREDIKFSVKLSQPALSNYTFDENKLTVKVNGETIPMENLTFSYIPGKDKWYTVYANFTQHHMPYGTYTISADYAGDAFHEAVKNSTELSLFLRPITISVHADNILYGETLVIDVTSNATNTVNGRILISVNGRTMSVPLHLNADGSYRYYIPNENYTSVLEPGNHIVSVIFENGTYYGVQTNSSYFNVSKLNTTLDVNYTNITYGENEIINVTVNETANGYIALRMGSQVYVAIIDHGIARFNITGLAAGLHNATLTFPGDNHFNATAKNITFTVNATKNYPFDVKVDNIEYKQNATVRVLVPTDAKGNVTIYVDGINWGTVKVTNGTASLGNVSGLAGGQHVVNVTYNGDSTYAVGYKNNTYFMVNPTGNWSMAIKGDYKPYGENTTITIETPVGLSKHNVTIKIDNITYIVPINVTTGKAVLVLNNLSAGSHNASVSYGGDANYSGKTSKFFPSITKATPTIKLDIVNGDVVATVSGNATGDVTFYIPGGEYNETIENGNATLSNDKLSIGMNGIIAVYNGDGNYTWALGKILVPVDKLTSTVNVTATNRTVGEDVTINVTVTPGATGYVFINVNGNNYTINLTAGEDRVVLNDLANGTYEVTANYIGDDTYKSSEGTTSFIVSKLNTTVRIDVDDITYGDDANIIVYVDSGVEGNITIKLGSEVLGTYDIVDGKVNVVAHKPGAGDYTVYAEYNGNYKYNENRTASKGFTVDKATPTITIDHEIVDALTPAVIHVHINPDAVGNITICVAGNGMPSYVYEAPIVDGVAEFTLDVLPVNRYNITADFYDDRHGGIDTNYSMHSVWEIYALRVVRVTDYPMSVNATDVKAGENTTITVVVPENATGTVFIDVNGTWVNRRVGTGGITTFEVSKDRTGRYYVNAFLDDNKYALEYVHTYYYVEYSDIPMSINVSEPVYTNDTAIITVAVPKDVNSSKNGTVTIEIDGKVYNNVSFIDCFVKFEVPNISYGNKTVVANFSGSHKYYAKAVTANFTVNKKESVISVDATNATVGGDVIVNVTVTPEATGYVIVNVNGTEYAINLTAGEDRVTVKNVGYGTFDVTATYLGDDIYALSSDTCTFDVSDTRYDVVVDAADITYGDVEEVTVYVNATGSVTLKLNNETYDTRDLSGGRVVFPIEGLSAGNYTVEAIYIDPSGNVTSAKADFTVEKADPTVNVEVEDIVYGDVEHIKVNVNARGNVTVRVNDSVVYELTLENGHYVLRAVRSGSSNYKGSASVDVENLNVGKYLVEVTYNGNDDYNALTVTKEFYVVKANTSVSLDVEQVMKPGETQVMNITMAAGNETGKVVINIDDEKYTRDVTNGTVEFTIPALDSGKHNIIVIYEGDGNFNANWTSTAVTVEKAGSSISVDATNSTAGEEVIIDVAVAPDATGYVVVDVNGVGYVINLTDGKGSITLKDLPEGEYDVTATYVGDDNYASSVDTTSFKVEKASSSLSVEMTDNPAGSDQTITVRVDNDDSTGYVIVDVDGETYAVKLDHGVGSITVSGLAAGNHTINATYLGNDAYGSATDNITVELPKLSSDVAVSVDNITSGDKAVIEITVPENATGTATVNIDGDDYTVYVAGGKGTLAISDLEVGPHEVTVTYNGDGVYDSSTGSAAFEVTKSEAGGTVKLADQGNGTVVVEVPDYSKGNVTVKLGDDTYTAEIVDGKAIVNLENATPGVHDITVTVPGDESHPDIVMNATANIPKDETSLDVSVSNIKVGDNAEIVVKVPENATGNITIEIDGKSYTKPVSGGEARFEIEDLTAGNKTALIKYAGDDNYVSNVTSATFSVSKVNATIKVTINDSKVGENVTVDVVLPQDATGVVLIDIGGVGYYANVTGGVAHVDIPRIPSGNYDVTVTYTGDDKYSSASDNAQFNMSKVDSFVIPNAIDIIYGENEVITLNVPEDATGTVTLVIDGVEYTFQTNNGVLSANENPNTYTVAVSGGMGTTTISGLPEGEYVVSARYNGDDKYFSVTNSTKFRVTKAPASVDVTDQKNGTVLVKLPSDAEGNVTVKVGNETYFANVENGTAWVTLDNASPGVHDIEVTYSGDSNYGPNTVHSSVVIPKYDSPISVDVSDIDVGDTLDVEITLPDGASGNVTVEIDGEEYSATIEDGKVTVPVSGLKAGNKTLIVKYDGDDNYLPNVTTARFAVSKLPSTAKPTPNDISVGNDEVITVDVPKDATGRVLVEIDGVGYYGDIINGKAKVIIPDLPVGSYNATVAYEGDDKYLPSDSTTVSFSVSKVAAPMSASGDSIVVGDNETISVILPEDATGTVTVNVSGESYTKEVNNGKAVFVLLGLASGEYDILASYSGDDKYLPSTSSNASFTVSKAKAPMSASGASIVVGDDATVTVNLPEDATGTVTLKIDGVTYATAEVKYGKAVFVVHGLKPGDHSIVAIYSGDDKYEGNMTSSDVEVYANKTPDDNHTHYKDDSSGIQLTRYATANPIMMLVIVLIAIGSSRLRRFKK